MVYLVGVVRDRTKAINKNAKFLSNSLIPSNSKYLLLWLNLQQHTKKRNRSGQGIVKTKVAKTEKNPKTTKKIKIAKQAKKIVDPTPAASLPHSTPVKEANEFVNKPAKEPKEQNYAHFPTSPIDDMSDIHADMDAQQYPDHSY
jgi:hypothetical protein